MARSAGGSAPTSASLAWKTRPNRSARRTPTGRASGWSCSRGRWLARWGSTRTRASAAEPERLDLGEVAVGDRVIETLQLVREGSRRAWGDIEVVGDALGLQIPDTFGVRRDEIEIELATLHVPPGDYDGEIRIHAEGGDVVSRPA